MSEPDDKVEMRRIGAALRTLRDRAGMTIDQAAEAMGFESGEGWRRYESGASPGVFKPAVQHRLLRAVKSDITDLHRILYPRGEVIDLASRRGAPPMLAELPIRDRIQAGAWLAADDYDQSTPRTYPAAQDPRYAHAPQWLSEVVGDSMNLAGIIEGDLAHCVDAEAIGYRPKTGDIVEVQRLRFGGSERELTIKQIDLSAGRIELWPRSTNKRWQEPLHIAEGVAEGEDFEVQIRALVVATIRRF